MVAVARWKVTVQPASQRAETDNSGLARGKVGYEISGSGGRG